MFRILLPASLLLLLNGCSREPLTVPLSRATTIRSFADEVTTHATVSIGRFRHAMSSVQGLPITETSTYSFAVTLPGDSRLRFRPFLHPAAEACWAGGPSLRVVFKQKQTNTNVELWQDDLTPQVTLRIRLWLQALITRTFPQYAPRSLLPPEVVLPIQLKGPGILRFEATGQRQPCKLDGWYAENGGHHIGPEAVWGMPMLQTAEFADRPDIILIVMDAVRADVLEMDGGPAHTPNLHRFAEEAIVFNRAFTLFPMTRESTFTLVTGMHPAQLGVPFWRWPLLPAERNIAAARAKDSLPVIARKNGLRSVFAGNNGFLVDTVPVGYDGQWGDLRFFYKEPYDTEATIRTMEEWAHDPQRLFAYLHFNQPHWPHRMSAGFPAQGTEKFPKEYLSEMADVDHSIGEIFSILRSTKRFDNSLIIITSDHGENFPAGEKAGHGTTLDPAELHVPLLIRLPHGLNGGRAITDAVSLADVFPTIQEYMQWTTSPTWGRSLMPLINGEHALLPPRTLVWEGKKIDGVSDGERFYTAHEVDYLPMEGVVAGATENAWRWPFGKRTTTPQSPTLADRTWLGRALDSTAAMRREAWRLFSGAAGEPPAPPRNHYVLAAPGANIETDPPGALRPVSTSADRRVFELNPPSATLRVTADGPVALGPWALPFGGSTAVITTATERRLLLGEPAHVNPPALWATADTDATQGLDPEVKNALRGWGYVK
jgi:hypothetical protein